MERTDLVVIGAGAVGLFTALEASRQGLQAVVLESSKPGAGASGANAGVLHLIQPPPGRLRRRLAPLGARLYREWARERGIERLETRLIIAAPTRPSSLLLRPLLAALRRLVPGINARIEGGRALRRLEPLLSEHVRAGIVVEGYGVVEPRMLMSRLARETSRRAALLEGVEAESVRCEAGRVIVETSAGEAYEARYAVNAAGAGAPGLASQHGIHVRVHLKPGTMDLYQAPRPGSIIARIPTSPKTKGGAVIPWPQGVLLGPDLREDTSQPPPPPEKLAARYQPLLAEPPRGLIERITGLRTVAKPRDFHIIRPPSCPRTVHLLGVESPGLTAAPALARIVLEKIGLNMPEGGLG